MYGATYIVWRTMKKTCLAVFYDHQFFRYAIQQHWCGAFSFRSQVSSVVARNHPCLEALQVRWEAFGTSKPVGRASDPPGRASKPAEGASDPAERAQSKLGHQGGPEKGGRAEEEDERVSVGALEVGGKLEGPLRE